MDTLVEFVSLVPAAGVFLGASVSVACWIAVSYWLVRLAVRASQLVSGRAELRWGEARGTNPAVLPRLEAFHEKHDGSMSWEYCVKSEQCWCSPKLVSFLGLKQNDGWIHWKHLRRRIHPDDVEELSEFGSQLLEQALRERQKLRIRCQNGEYRCLGCEVQIETSTTGQLELVYGVAIELEEDVARRPKVAQETPNGRWELLLDASEDGFWEWPRMDQDAQWWSNGFYRLLGREPGEVTPGMKAFMRLIHPSDRRCFDEGLKQTVLRMARFQVEARLRLKNDSYRWFSIVFVCEGCRGDEQARITGSIRDVQSQRDAQRQRDDTDEMFRSVFERTTVGLALIDASGIVLHANPALSRMLGVRSDQVRGVEWRAIVHSSDWSKFESIYSQIFGGEADYLQIENRYRAARGGSFDALTGLSRLSKSVGKGARVIAHIQDVTAIKQAERDANEASMCKTQFLAHMSREIRTPLNGVMGMTQLVLSTELTTEQRDFLVTAQESSEQLLTVINDILDLSKIEAGRFEIVESHFRLREALMSMSAPLSLRAHEKGLEFVLDIDPKLPDEFFGDWARLQQILINLIGNAIKFTEAGEVVIGMYLEESPKGKLENHGGADDERSSVLVRFQVTDTGMGIPVEQHQRIFGAFNQVDPSLNRGHQGTGLGLAISAELVRLMGGRITVSSEVGSGSQFEFTVELASIHTEGEICPWETTQPLSGLSVLLIDESISARAAQARLLRNWGVGVSSVGDLGAAKCEIENRAKQGAFDLIMMNSAWHSEAVNQGVIAADLKSGERPEIALMISSPDRADEVARCRDAGVRNYYLKPVDPQRLMLHLEGMAGHEPVKPQAVSLEHEPAKPSERRNILVVEDSPISRKVVVNLLKQQGHEVATAANGMEAVLQVGRSDFDAVVMDINMPEMDGLQATNLIREREDGSERRVWIIALTAQALNGDRDRCLAAGMDDYLSKPIRWPELWDAIERIPKSAEQSQDERIEHPLKTAESSESDDMDVLDSRRMVELAIDEVHLGRTRIGESIINQSAQELKDASHRLKGVLLQCQMVREADIAAKLEIMGQENRLDSATKLYADLVKSLIRIDRELQSKRGDLREA